VTAANHVIAGNTDRKTVEEPALFILNGGNGSQASIPAISVVNEGYHRPVSAS
jgi:hypothetical protein